MIGFHKLSVRSLLLVSLLCCTIGLSLFDRPAHSESEAGSDNFVWQQISEQGVFDVTLDARSTDALEINQFLEWILTVKTPDGEFVTPARISVGGGMAAHGHGLPSQPQIGEYLGEGRYPVEGIKFSMNGDWQLAFDIQSQDRRDKVVFELKIDY